MGFYEAKISRFYSSEESTITSPAERSFNSYFARTLKIAKSMKECGESMLENVITAKTCGQ